MPSAAEVRVRRQYGRSAGSSAGAGADLVGWFILAALWEHLDNPARVAWVVALVLIPVAIASALVYRCTAWRVTEQTRCEQRRPGPLQRCIDHRGQVITAPDVAAGICVLVSLFIIAAVVSLSQ